MFLVGENDDRDDKEEDGGHDGRSAQQDISRHGVGRNDGDRTTTAAGMRWQ